MAIERGPSNAVVSGDEPATFSCIPDVTGNEMLQFQVFETTITDKKSGYQTDTSTNTRTV